MGATEEKRAAGPRKGGRGWVVVPVLIFGALVAIFGFALMTGDPSKLPSALIGKPVPQTALAPVDGLIDGGQAVPGFDSTDLTDGNVSVVNFWASWCVPCAEEQPLLVDLQKRTGLTLYGINYKDDPVAARRFLGRWGNPFKTVGADPAGRAAIEWGVYGMPETFVVNGRGEIVYKHVGPVTPESIKDRLLPAIEKAQATAASASSAPATN